MGLRKQTIFLSLVSTLASPWVLGFGLGEIKLKSTLNQPLNAEIQLTQTKDLTDREILVGLASAADFARVGVDKPLFLGDLKFQVVMEPGKAPVVRVTSSRAVVEPYLNFIVQAQWPSGKLLREYTVLVDLPVYGGNEAESVAPAVSRPATSVANVETQLTQAPEVPRTRANRPAATAAPRPKTPRPAPVVDEGPIDAKPSGDTYGPVAGNDTLWKIARSNRPSGASIQQTMLAIQKLNPDAFINGNINLLRKGQTLRLPAADAASQVAVDEAARQVAANTPQRKAPSEESTGPQLDASKSVAKTEAKPSTVEGRVKLSSSNSTDSSKSGRGVGVDKGSKEALTNELTITKEELDAKSRESTDLNARLKAVDEQIENTERLIQVNSEEMHKLELAIEKNKQNQTSSTTPVVPSGADTPAATTEVPAAISADGKVVAPADATASAQTPPTETSKVDGPVETPPPSVTQPSPEPKPAETPATAPSKVKPATEPEGLVDLLKNNVLYIGAGLAVLLGLALVLLKRRRTDDDGPEPWVDASDNSDGGWGADFSFPGFDETKPVVDTAIADTDDVTQFQLAPVTQSVKLETDDVVSESDIHIALEDYDTAEKLLLSSLEQDPANSRVLLKLLEVYSRKQDVESFDRQYAKLKAFCDEDAAARAEQLRSYIDNAPPFDGHKYSDEAFLAAVNGKVESDDTTQLASAVAVGAAVTGASFVAQPFADFDFAATLQADELTVPDELTGSDITQFMAPVAEGNDSFTLDFDEAAVAETAPSGDRKSLAELLVDEGGEDSLDLSDFDDLSFDKSAEPQTSLDEPGDSSSELTDLDFSFDSEGLEGLDESDFELDENALGGELDSFTADELHLDASLDAGFDDLDEPVASAPAAEPVDEFADLDLSALDYDLSEHDLETDPEIDLPHSSKDQLSDESTRGLGDVSEFDKDEFDFSLDSELSTQRALSGAMAELDALDEQSFDLDESFSLDDLESLSAPSSLESALTEIDKPLGNPTATTKRQDLESLLDFEDTFGELDTAPLADEADQDELSTPTLVMSAITDRDLPTEDLDFDELDADLGALAAEFDGDLSDLDDLDSPTLVDASSHLMDEPVTQFGEMDDVDPADILGDGPKERPEIDLEDFDDSVTFAIEDPLTDLDAESELNEDALESLGVSNDFAAVAGELGTAVNFDGGEDLVEFEDLDNLENLAELDLLNDADDALAIDLDDDELDIPRVSAADIDAEFQLPDFDPESDDDSDLGALCDGDELDTKLDLLRAFVDMGDEDSAKHTLEEILEEGSEEQRKQANALMARIS